eukprot:8096712-Ditylum_brightwellii.AAC.1
MQYSQLFCMTLSGGTTSIPLSCSPASFQLSVPSLLPQLFHLSSILLVNFRKPHLFNLKLFPKGTNITSRQLTSSSCFASNIPRPPIKVCAKAFIFTLNPAMAHCAFLISKSTPSTLPK